MSDRLVTVATFESPHEAHVTRIRLETEGIRAFVNDDGIVNALWHVGTALGGVKLQVADADKEAAENILYGGDTKSSEEDAPATAWICPDCRVEVDAGFAICWSCGAALSDRAELGPANGAVSWQYDRFKLTTELSLGTERFAAEMSVHADPHDSPWLQAQREDVEVTVARAWRASIIGLFLCPGILHFYSMWLLLMVSFDESKLTRRATWMFYTAWFVNVAIGMISFFLIQSLLKYD